MAKELDQKKFDKLVGVLKKHGFEQSYNFYCNESGIEYSEIGRYIYKAELEADPKRKVPATATGIAKAKDSGLRWPRVAAYAGVTVARAKQLYEETGKSASEAYSGRGRKFDGNGNGASASKSGSTAGTTPRASGAKAKTKTATSGRRQSKAGTAAAKKTATAAPGRRPGRRTTRAAAATSDPK